MWSNAQILDLSFIIYTSVFVILLILSAFFSGSETAFFSLKKTTLKRFSSSKQLAERQISHLLKDPKKLLITIILGNTVVNIAIASLSALLTIRFAHSVGIDETISLLINVVIVTAVILFFSEIMPKITAVKNAEKIAKLYAAPLLIFYYLLLPFSSFLNRINNVVVALLKVDKDKFELSDDELKTLVDLGEEKGALEQDEKEMIHSILEMSDTLVREIMVPRTDMIAIDVESTLHQTLSIAKEKLHSRIPVYSEKTDDIAGILYLKDLLPFIRKKNTDTFDLKKIVRPIHYVPEQKKINELLREFQAEKIHMAIVVDEYGGTSGLVTLEDVIEEIVGEIQDEYDKETPDLKKINETSFLVDGGMDLDDLNEELGLNLPTETGVDTLAGFLLGQFGTVPNAKETISWNGYEFIVEKATDKRIQLVKINLKKR
jgi:gliding motility-associated protein GldE